MQEDAALSIDRAQRLIQNKGKPEALPVWQGDGSAYLRDPTLSGGRLVHNRGNCDGFLVYKKRKHSRGRMNLCAHIVKGSEHFPRLTANGFDRDVDFRSRSMNPPPGVIFARSRSEHPVRSQPFFDVFVTRDGDELPIVFSHVFLHRVRADLCNLSIDYAREFVDHQWAVIIGF